MVVPYCHPKSNVLVMCGCNPFILSITDACTHKPGMTRSRLVFFRYANLRFHISTPITLPESDDLGKKKWKQNMSLETSRNFDSMAGETKPKPLFCVCWKSRFHMFFSHFGVISPTPHSKSLRPILFSPSAMERRESRRPFWLNKNWEFCDVSCSKTKCDS